MKSSGCGKRIQAWAGGWGVGGGERFSLGCRFQGPWHPFVAQIPAKEKAKEGETVALNCQFHSPWGPSLSKLTVKWYKVDEKGQRDLLENNVTVLTNYSRVFIHGNLSQGDASLTILNVTASDHGIYFCQVTLSSGKVVMGSGTKYWPLSGEISHCLF
uniref:Ig-like domain-containing protein n=1 Tax=Gopherus evgoodei TaxID=1825980 RepID=A0A8C4VBR1_9SAUR